MQVNRIKVVIRVDDKSFSDNMIVIVNFVDFQPLIRFCSYVASIYVCMCA